MRTQKEIEEKIVRLKKRRAGSLFTREFESGMMYSLYWVLNKEPKFKYRKDVEKFMKQWDENEKTG